MMFNQYNRWVPMSDITPSAVYDLDATISSSYSGSGTSWNNLIASPADGSAQSAYNFVQRGSQSFTGTADSPSSYFNSNNTGGWNVPPTSFISNLQRTDLGIEYTAVFSFRTPSSLGSTNKGLMGTSSNLVANGVYNVVQTNNRAILRHQNGSAGVGYSPVNALTTDTDYILAVMVNSTTGEIKFFINKDKFEPSPLTWLTNTTPSPATQYGLFSSATGLGLPWPAGTRFYAASFFNKFLTDFEYSNVFIEYQRRHKRNY